MARAAALVLVILGLLPLANWIPGGHDAPWYSERLALWLPGTAILLGIAVITGIALRRHPGLWRAGAWQRLALRWLAADRRGDAVVAAVALGCYALVSQVVFSGRPLLIDEVVQTWQARVFASGRLFLPVPAHPEFTSVMHLVDLADKLYGQFPAGGPAMMMLGTLVGAEWLVGPVFAAVGVFVFARLMRWVEPAPGTALAAVLLAAFAPFALFLDGSMMNHVTTTTWLLGAALALAHVVGEARPRPLASFASGLCLGMAATIRPIDAMAFALPTAAWLGWRVLRDRRHLGALLASGLGVLVPLVALGWVNAVWSGGDPFRFGYITLWGRSHELGFHEAPWGFAHTPLRGLELVNLYLLRLQSYFLETPAPSLLFATGTLALTRRLRAFDRWVLASCALLLFGYWAYWHDGFYLGPRFMLPLAPWLAWWTARLPGTLAERRVPEATMRAVVVTGAVALLIAATQLVPIRWAQYRNGMLSMKFDPVAAATAAGVPDGALILVRESWGAQLMARLWGVGISRTDAERIYRSTDACRLDEVLGRAEEEGVGPDSVLAWLAPYRADSTRLVAQRASPDTTLRALPGATWEGRCVRRILEDRAGTSLFTPAILADTSRYEFRRDLHATDSLLGLSDREVWLQTQLVAPGSPLRFTRVDPDSMRRDWDTP